jgi:hypothetical protein
MADRSNKEAQARLDAISEWAARIGAKGGKVGGKATGPSKNRGPEHYAKMVAARKAKRASE